MHFNFEGMNQEHRLLSPGEIEDAINFWLSQEAEIVEIDLGFLNLHYGKLAILREDQLLESISGNKLRKLLPNLQKASENGLNKILTFGGAYSNHIAATAAAGRLFNFETIGVIRGQELADKVGSNPTLSRAQNNGMRLKFVDREAYRRRIDPDFLEELNREFGPCLLVPEGGTNEDAINGVANMARKLPEKYNVICTAVGTGGTMAGILSGVHSGQEVWGFSALKGVNHKAWLHPFGSGIKRRIFDQYHFGGYAKTSAELIEFINKFKAETGIPLDPVYTGKMIYGLVDQLRSKPEMMDQNILAIHTGGLQGILGHNALNKTTGNTIL
jgi:1-aminocyclopropane-1-carboxylate deaminase